MGFFLKYENSDRIFFDLIRFSKKRDFTEDKKI
jgi:hypothetical protein